MSNFRIGTNYAHNNSAYNISVLQSKMADMNKKISGGNRYDSFVELSDSGNIKSVIDIGENYTMSEGIIFGAQVVKLKIDAMRSCLGQLLDIAYLMRDEVIGQNNPALVNLDALRGSVKESMKIIQSVLNTRISGDYIFSGHMVNTAPIENLNVPNLSSDVGGSVDFLNGDVTKEYYKADYNKKVVEIESNMTFEYGVTAADNCFSDLIAAAHILLEGAKQPGNSVKAFLHRASSLMDGAIEGMTNIRLKLMRELVIAEKVQENREDMRTMHLNRQHEIDKSYNLEMSNMLIKYQEYNNILNAAMKSHVVISQLNIMDYIK